MFYAENGKNLLAGLSVIDRPSTSLASVSDLMFKLETATSDDERMSIQKQMMDRMGVAADRVFVGRWDGNATLVLRDAQSRPRLTLSVSPDGDAKVQFLNEKGEIVRELRP